MPAHRSTAHAVLVIDPDPEQRHQLRDRLTALGHPSDEAGSQFEAQECLLSRSYCFLVLEPDLPMRHDQEPDEEVGWSLLTWVRAQHAWEDLPVVLVTRLRGDEARLRALQEGANDWAAKPARTGADRLEAKLRRLTDRCEARRPGGCVSQQAPAPQPSEPRDYTSQHRIHLRGDLEDGKHVVVIDGVRLLLPEGSFAALWRLALANRDAPGGWVEGERVAGSRSYRMAIYRLRKALSDARATDLIEGDRHGKYRLTSSPRVVTLERHRIATAGLGYLLQDAGSATKSRPPKAGGAGARR